MAATTDMTTMFKDMMGAFPFDTKPFEDAFKNTAEFNEKVASVALTAAEKNVELTSKWTSETLIKISDLAKAKADPAEYAKAVTDFASTQAEVTAENLAAYAEVAKKAQMDAVELLMAMGKEVSEEAGKAVKTATNNVTAAAKKAAAK